MSISVLTFLLSNEIGFLMYLSHEYVLPEDLEVLAGMRAPRRIRSGDVRLIRMKLASMAGNHHVVATPRGMMALHGVFVGCRVIVTDKYRLGHIHGCIGSVVAIADETVDADGLDDYGNVIPRAKPAITVSVQLEEYPYNVWCFHEMGTLAGLTEHPWASGQPREGYFWGRKPTKSDIAITRAAAKML